MEKTKSAFSPGDRIGALEVSGISVQDARDLLLARGGSAPAGIGMRADDLVK
jgi:hypothetical protein